MLINTQTSKQSRKTSQAVKMLAKLISEDQAKEKRMPAASHPNNDLTNHTTSVLLWLTRALAPMEHFEDDILNPIMVVLCA